MHPELPKIPTYLPGPLVYKNSYNQYNGYIFSMAPRDCKEHGGWQPVFPSMRFGEESSGVAEQSKRSRRWAGVWVGMARAFVHTFKKGRTLHSNLTSLDACGLLPWPQCSVMFAAHDLREFKCAKQHIGGYVTLFELH